MPATCFLRYSAARYKWRMYYVYELIRNAQVVYVGCTIHPGRCFDQHTVRNREFDYLRVISSHEKRWEAVLRAQHLLEACPLFPAYQPPRRHFSTAPS